MGSGCDTWSDAVYQPDPLALNALCRGVGEFVGCCFGRVGALLLQEGVVHLTRALLRYCFLSLAAAAVAGQRQRRRGGAVMQGRGQRCMQRSWLVVWMGQQGRPAAGAGCNVQG